MDTKKLKGSDIINDVRGWIKCIVQNYFSFSLDCRSLSSSLWTSEPSFLGQMTAALSASYTPSPRMHHLPALSYSTQPPPYTSYLPSSPPPPLSHSCPFQHGGLYFGPNQTAGEERSVVTGLTNYIEGACLSIRGEEPVWRPY